MEELLRPFQVFRTLSAESVKALVDILLVSYVIYRLLALIRGQRAWRILGGVLVFIVVLIASKALDMRALHWLMDKASILGPVALVILLLPELRQALEGFGKLGFWPQRAPVETQTEARTVEELVAACAELAASRTGALIVVERGAPLEDVVGNGVTLDSMVSAALLGSIFYGTNPLHDGAVVIRDRRIVAAACRLPLSDNPRIDPLLHMRHRAAMGVTEQMDCVAIVVSEERGTISFVADGHLKGVTTQELREELNRELRKIEPTRRRSSRRLRIVKPNPEEDKIESRIS